jgi:hypothetical protein
MLNEPEAQQKCPACGEANCFDHAIRTAKAQPQGGEPPEKLWVQLTPMGGTISYISKPPDNRKPVYEYVRADLPRATADSAER